MYNLFLLKSNSSKFSTPQNPFTSSFSILFWLKTISFNLCKLRNESEPILVKLFLDKSINSKLFKPAKLSFSIDFTFNLDKSSLVKFALKRENYFAESNLTYRQSLIPLLFVKQRKSKTELVITFINKFYFTDFQNTKTNFNLLYLNWTCIPHSSFYQFFLLE